jgi:hypothetical protein
MFRLLVLFAVNCSHLPKVPLSPSQFLFFANQSKIWAGNFVAHKKKKQIFFSSNFADASIIFVKNAHSRDLKRQASALCAMLRPEDYLMWPTMLFLACAKWKRPTLRRRIKTNGRSLID